MNDLQTLYPANPSNVPAAVTAPSPAFKKEVKKVMGSVFLFFLVYIILIGLSILLSVVCVLLGIGLMSMLTNLIGIAGGLGIISIGILVFVFLVKFIFSVKKFDTSGSIEITAKEQPVLFGFIHNLTKDTQTQFPKKIVLSPEVNACVFYNDSFWSMIFPVKKNLQIGLGLVNTLTISEFKAVMAHEFGHFSQRSMKLGSFVYNVNKVIYNMLFENNNYSAFLRGWGNLHWAINIFMHITVGLVQGIQKILQKMYGFINKSYMSLSREMEFHADAVAASVCGGNNLISALQKIEVSGSCYSAVMQKANDWLHEKTVFENIYAKHNVVMKEYAREHNLSLLNNTPQLTSAFYRDFQQSKINIKNQWASHPTREDREMHLQQLHVEGIADNRPAWLLFNQPDELQKKLTEVLYKTVPEDMKANSINDETFKERYLNETAIYNLPAVYNGYYDGRQMAEQNADKLFIENNHPAITRKAFEELFSAEKTGLPKLLQANQSDAAILEAIINKQIDLKTFDYSGGKYDKNDAPSVLETLQKEILQQQQQVKENDAAVINFFYAAAGLSSSGDALALKGMYITYFANNKKTDEFTAICHRVINLLSPLLEGRKVSIQDANDIASGLRKESNYMRPLLANWTDARVFDGNTVRKEKIMKFCGALYQYFSGDSFFDSELQAIHEIVNGSMQDVAGFQSKKLKQLLEYQLQFFEKQVTLV